MGECRLQEEGACKFAPETELADCKRIREKVGGMFDRFSAGLHAVSPLDSQSEIVHKLEKRGAVV